MANMNIQKVLTQYAEEISLKEMPRTRQSRKVKTEEELLWDNWYEMAGKYEPEMVIKEDDEPESSRTSAKSSKKKKKVNVKVKARRQRQMTLDSKLDIQHNVTAIVKNFAKRLEEDFKNVSSIGGRTSYCKKRGGSNVLEPKSQVLKTARILKTAWKMGLIDESIKKEAYEIMDLLGIITLEEEKASGENNATEKNQAENIEESAA